MHPILQDLITQHFKSTDQIPAELSPFIADLNKQLDSAVSNQQQQDSDEFLQEILNAISFGITVVDYNKKILYANQNALTTIGYSKLDEIAGHICHDTMCPAQEGQCPILDLKEKIDRSERKLVRRDGSRIPILKSVAPIIYNGQQALLETFVDITEEVRFREESKIIYDRRGKYVDLSNQIIKELAGKENLAELYASLVEQVQTQFGLVRVQFFGFNPAVNTLKLIASAGEGTPDPAKEYFVQLNTGLVGAAAATQTVMTAEGADLEKSQFPDLFTKKTKSQIAIPILFGENVLGILDVQGDASLITDKDIQLTLESLVTQTAVIAEGSRLRMNMQEQLAELNILQQMTTSEGWKNFGDISALSSHRYLYDQNLGSAIPLPANEPLQAEKVIHNPLQVRGEVIGSLGIQASEDNPLTDEEQALLDSISSEVAEALERARLFETSQRSAAELAVLNEMGTQFAQALDEEKITQLIYSYTERLMETPQFYVAFYHQDSDEISFPYVVMASELVTEEHPLHDQWLPRPVTAGLTGHIIRSKQPILIENNVIEVLKELGLPYREFGGQTQSWLGVPILIGDRVLGVINVQSEDIPNLYNRHHLDLLTTIASQAAVAINNIRLFQQEQERAEQERLVRTITDKVRRSSDTQTILKVALEELSHILNAETSSVQLGTPDQLIAASVKTENASTNGKKTHPKKETR